MKITKVGQHEVYKGAVFNVNKKMFEREDGSTFSREIVESSDVVHILPIDRANNVYAINEFRGSVEDFVIGFPAGKIDANETPAEAATREIEEEIGMKVVHLNPIHGNLVSTMGICNEVGHYFIALVEPFKEGERKNFPDTDENIEVQKLYVDDFAEKLYKMAENHQQVGLKTIFLWVMFMTTMLSRIKK